MEQWIALVAIKGKQLAPCPAGVLGCEPRPQPRGVARSGALQAWVVTTALHGKLQGQACASKAKPSIGFTGTNPMLIMS